MAQPVERPVAQTQTKTLGLQQPEAFHYRKYFFVPSSYTPYTGPCARTVEILGAGDASANGLYTQADTTCNKRPQFFKVLKLNEQSTPTAVMVLFYDAKEHAWTLKKVGKGVAAASLLSVKPGSNSGNETCVYVGSRSCITGKTISASGFAEIDQTTGKTIASSSVVNVNSKQKLRSDILSLTEDLAGPWHVHPDQLVTKRRRNSTISQNQVLHMIEPAPSSVKIVVGISQSRPTTSGTAAAGTAAGELGQNGDGSGSRSVGSTRATETDSC